MSRADPITTALNEAMKERSHCDKAIEQLRKQLRQEELRRKKFVKVIKVLGGVDSENSKTAPTLAKVKAAAQKVFARWPESEISAARLSEELLKTLEADPQLSRQGLGLRVQQFLAKCPRSESSNSILVPEATTSDSSGGLSDQS